MNLGQLEVFVAIVNSGSLKKAAETIGITHSAVSYSLSKFEAELGVTLLERGRQGITLTRIGEIVLEHARNILGEAEIIRQEANRDRGLSAGKIRFACVPQVPSRLLTGIVRDFQYQYPDIEVVLFQGHEPEVRHWLEKRIVDVGTLVQKENYPQSAQFLESNVAVLLPVGHRLAQQPKVTLHELKHEPLIGTRREIEATTEITPAYAFSELQLQHQVTETQTIIAMVAEGMGVAIMPHMVIDEVSSQKVVFKPLHPTVIMRAFLVANINSPITQAFLEVAQNWTKSHGYLPADT